MVTAFYERPQQRAYFAGCSTGGKQALMAAQRYPEDFDGIVAGAAAYNPSHIHGTQVWTGAISNRSDEARLTAEDFSLLNDASLAACDTLDGVADGVIENPLQCDFDPGVLACGAGDSGACLNPAQVETARLIYTGPTASDGSPIYAGLTRGSEAGWNVLSAAEPLSIARETYELLVHEPGWDWRGFDAESEIALAVERIDPLLGATDPDLADFIDNGGKLILYHGWSDSGIPPGGTIRYLESVRDTLGAGVTDDSVRLFMVPGMGHCAGGTGTDRFDMIAALDDWFESGNAPDRVDAARVVNGETVRTRPLCAYPSAASYDGDGSTDEAANFSCR
jgi:feruloyl esterase